METNKKSVTIRSDPEFFRSMTESQPSTLNNNTQTIHQFNDLEEMNENENEKDVNEELEKEMPQFVAGK